MVTRMVFLALALACARGVGAGEPASHVRAASVAAHTLLTEGRANSAIVNALLRRLDTSDVIVYVELSIPPVEWVARTVFVASSPDVRFLRISISALSPPMQRLPLLAHELQHAVEIADATSVRDEETLGDLYRSIGWSSGAARFETAAARDVERRVEAELFAASHPRGAPRRALRLPRP